MGSGRGAFALTDFAAIGVSIVLGDFAIADLAAIVLGLFLGAQAPGPELGPSSIGTLCG